MKKKKIGNSAFLGTFCVDLLVRFYISVASRTLGNLKAIRRERAQKRAQEKEGGVALRKRVGRAGSSWWGARDPCTWLGPPKT